MLQRYKRSHIDQESLWIALSSVCFSNQQCSSGLRSMQEVLHLIVSLSQIRVSKCFMITFFWCKMIVLFALAFRYSAQIEITEH